MSLILWTHSSSIQLTLSFSIYIYEQASVLLLELRLNLLAGQAS